MIIARLDGGLGNQLLSEALQVIVKLYVFDDGQAGFEVAVIGQTQLCFLSGADATKCRVPQCGQFGL